MYYINGEYVADDAAKVAVTDLGITRGYGVFDYLRTYSGRPFHLQDHLERLAYSAMTLGLELSHSLSEIAEIVATLLKNNSYPESAVKIIATGGISPDQFLPSGPSSLMILVYPLKTFSDICYAEGINVATTSLKRSFPWAKTLHYAPAIVALQKGKTFNAQEILYLNEKNELLEAATCNAFVVKGRKILTTPESADILIGITRNVILKIAEDHFEIEQRMVSLKEIEECDELFITSSTREVMPVVKVDGKPVGRGVVGAVTKALIHHFSDYVQRPEWIDLKIARYRAALRQENMKDQAAGSPSHLAPVV